MRISIHNNCIDTKSLLNYSEDFLKEKFNYHFATIDEEFKDCVFEDFDLFNDEYVFSLEKYNKRKQKVKNQNKLIELSNWFDNYFDKQLTQSQWQNNFKVSPDPYFKDESGNPKTYADIEELKAQAEIVREEIKSLINEV